MTRHSRVGHPGRPAIGRTARGAVLFSFGVMTLSAATTLGGCGPEVPEQTGASNQLTLVTRSGRHPITVEVADTDEKKQIGLMFRTELADAHGMLFPYHLPHEITMWMKHTYISLDMVFIGVDGQVVRVARGTEPMSEAIVSSEKPALGVLELKAGAADRYGIEAGSSRVEHPHFRRREP